jgi:hypothetical protein
MHHKSFPRLPLLTIATLAIKVRRKIIKKKVQCVVHGTEDG